MIVSKSDVVEALSGEELDCRKAEQLGAEALPHLKVLVKGEDELLASRAVWLAVRIDREKSLVIVKIAADREIPSIRMAAGFACNSLRGPEADKILNKLKQDPDEVIRAKVAKFISKRVQ